MRWWLRSLGIGAAVGFATGLTVGGILGRAFMRLLFLAREDTGGFETAMGAIIGDFTAGGSLFISLFGAATGLVLGIAYVCVRPSMPSGIRWRIPLFAIGASGLMLGLVVRDNREDFELLPVTPSLILIASAVAITAIPVPVLIERYAPDRERSPGRIAHALTGLGLAAITGYAAMAVASAYAVEPLF